MKPRNLSDIRERADGEQIYCSLIISGIHARGRMYLQETMLSETRKDKDKSAATIDSIT